MLFPGAIAQARLSTIAEVAAAFFDDLEAAIAAQGLEAVCQQLLPSDQFNPRSTTVHYSAIARRHPDYLKDLAEVLSSPSLSQAIAAALGGEPVCQLSQVWLRKQYAPSHAPPLHHPHSWHQDGAFGLSFPAAAVDHPYVDLVPVPWVTSWLPLTDCGRFRPGLQLITQDPCRLLHYQYLNDRDLQHWFSQEAFWTPEMQLGDGLVFQPTILHRTWCHPEMTGDRLSLECRFTVSPVG